LRSWEVTQVNELLHRMENFNGVMVGATNFTQNLDPAVVRRFTFKLEFRYLDEAGNRLFFERMFRSKLSTPEAKRLAGIPDLAPGDYRTVRQGLHYLGKGITNGERLAALERESQAKGHNRYTTKKIGF
jgi:transitional endoplasmic reticulum ATPase